ncbi:hypothetical protein [Nereida sp. MMG025]|uniref:hypothetical protein n=1 Tax=Nereida sp. MMG025 TaxID=2909981 RepID=UPI001F35D108|nr:hypothetical protein [Nereida sp. MMG025]MCF6444304.1 hypothetical protein [Nereida sp. MMG025]
MGSLRRGLIIAALAIPTPVWAEVCDKERPDWNGTPVTAWGEFLYLLTTPLTMLLLCATALAFRLARKWLTVAVAVGWTAYTCLLAFNVPTDATSISAAALREGCVGSPALFIAFACALTLALVFYVSRGADAPPQPPKE